MYILLQCMCGHGTTRSLILYSNINTTYHGFFQILWSLSVFDFVALTGVFCPQVWRHVEMLGRRLENPTQIWRSHPHYQWNHSQHRVWCPSEGRPRRHLHQCHPTPHAGLPLPWHAHRRVKKHAGMMSVRHWCQVKNLRQLKLLQCCAFLVGSFSWCIGCLAEDHIYWLHQRLPSVNEQNWSCSCYWDAFSDTQAAAVRECHQLTSFECW